MINWKKRQGHSLHSVARLVVAAGRSGGGGAGIFRGIVLVLRSPQWFWPTDEKLASHMYVVSTLTAECENKTARRGWLLLTCENEHQARWCILGFRSNWTYYTVSYYYINETTGWRTGVRFPTGARFSSYHCFQISSKANLAPIKWAPGALPP
jgi:hypothetical protein